MTATAGPAPAQPDGRSPSADELWDDYPLGQQQARGSPAPTAAPSAAARERPAPTAAPSVAARERPAPRGEPTSEDYGPPVATVVALVGLAVIGAGVVLLFPRGRKRTAPEGAAATAEVGAGHRSAPPEDAPPPDTALPPRAARAPLRPPDPDRLWTAEVEWHAGQGTAAFQVVARDAPGEEAMLARSAPVPWPPTEAGAVQAMAAEAEALANALRASGWDPLPGGGAWYATRCIWHPPGARADGGRDHDATEEVSSP